MSARLHRALARLRDPHGYTVVELLTSMVVLVTIMASLTTLFVNATKAETDMNFRFQAQQAARIALDKIRREAHCASAATASVDRRTVTLTMPAQCPTGDISYCLVLSGTKYNLWRKAGTTCNATGATKVASSLTSASGFDAIAASPQYLAKIHLDLYVNVKSNANQEYQLSDDVFLRNSVRA